MPDPRLGIAIDQDKAFTCKETIRSDPLLPVASTFANNTHGISDLLSLPKAFLKRGILLGIVAERAGKTLDERATVSREEINQLGSQMVQAYATYTGNVAVEATIDEAASGELKHLLRSNELLRACVDTLLRASITAAWTMLECLTGDTWEALVNNRPKRLITLALSKYPEF
jgi:hypothetical protein